MISRSSMEVLLCCLTALMVRWMISLGPYSGKGKAPMFGDFEAQRHWQEIAINLPVNDWYWNTSDNDLMYWGLDYPPLTAYHSYILGYVANKSNNEWIQLFTSRGYESHTHKLFMRYSVLITDAIIYIPAVICYMLCCGDIKNYRDQLASSLTMLLYPGLMLIDHGHFQYNSISLGLTLWSIIFLKTNYDLLASVAFCLALNYKQMELYHAMPIFCYLLGKCFTGKENWFIKLGKLGTVVIATFGLCWLPFLHDPASMAQVVHRLFPFARGLFEDKVANFWCSVSILIKLKNIFEGDQLVLICLGTTGLALLPSSILLLLKPSIQRLKFALINASLVFFLFSYQVHEKSILIVALPVCLLLHQCPEMGTWFLQISTFSMLPLLLKDGLLIEYLGSTLLFHIVSSLLYKPSNKDINSMRYLRSAVVNMSYVGCAVLLLCSLLVQPPVNLPDLWPVLISAYSAAHFLVFLGYFHYWQYYS